MKAGAKVEDPARHPAFRALYAIIYPLLVEVGAETGYAMTLHGSLAKDLDVVAVPWTPDAVPVEDLVREVRRRLEAVQVEPRVTRAAAPKPHGRLSFLLHVAGGVSVDLSVFPPSRG